MVWRGRREWVGEGNGEELRIRGEWEKGMEERVIGERSLEGKGIGEGVGEEREMGRGGGEKRGMGKGVEKEIRNRAKDERRIGGRERGGEKDGDEGRQVVLSAGTTVRVAAERPPPSSSAGTPPLLLLLPAVAQGRRQTAEVYKSPARTCGLYILLIESDSYISQIISLLFFFVVAFRSLFLWFVLLLFPAIYIYIYFRADTFLF